MSQNSMKSLLIRGMSLILWTGIVISFLFLLNLKLKVEERSINVFAWDGTFVRSYIKKFEEVTGIKVYLSIYNSNEELLTKLFTSRAKGYDLVVPSGYVMKRLIKADLLKKIDRTQLNFFDKINPLLLGHFFDPKNEYSIPFEWEIYCVGINTNFISKDDFSNPWDLIFKRPHNTSQKIIMVNDLVEAIIFAATYLYGHVENLSDRQLEKVRMLLINQREWVEAYCNVRTDYFLGTDNAVAVVAQSSEVWRAMRDYKNVDFIIPEKPFVSIESCVIPKESKKENLVYEFMNFFFTKESFVHHFGEQLFCPARLDVIDELPATERQKVIMRSSKNSFDKYLFIRDLVSEQKRYDTWIAVKS